VIAPSVVTILSTIGAGVLLGERLTPAHLIGAAMVLAGILLIAGHGALASPIGASTWIGDLLFFASSVLWAGFTLLIRYWRVDAVRATAVVAVLSLCVSAPIYLAYRGPAHLLDLPIGLLAVQGVVQGLVQAVITIMAYSRAIAILGVSRAVLFPAIVPAISIIIGIPLLGEIPTTLQVAGLLFVSLGLLVAIGILKKSL
jgi:drug/metabolite transporter (DMT)-like permease